MSAQPKPNVVQQQLLCCARIAGHGGDRELARRLTLEAAAIRPLTSRQVEAMGRATRHAPRYGL